MGVTREQRGASKGHRGREGQSPRSLLSRSTAQGPGDRNTVYLDYSTQPIASAVSGYQSAKFEEKTPIDAFRI